MQIIHHNRAQCLKCGEVIESLNLDYIPQCYCGNVTAYGGKLFISHSARDDRFYKDRSVVQTTQPSQELDDVVAESLSEPPGADLG